MSTSREPGQSPAAHVFRRRVVFELTVDQLPLLDAAEARHGSKRQALLAALQAETRVEQLEQEVVAAQAALAKRERAAASPAKSDAKLAPEHVAARDELRQARAELKRLRAQLDRAEGEAGNAQALAAADRDEYEEALAARDEEIADLAERAVDRLFCGRCNSWPQTAELVWVDAKGGGEYAYHESCGDHGPGVLGAASRLAYRDT
jgi:hypothetical protein